MACAPVFWRECDATAQRCFGFVGAIGARLCFGEQVQRGDIFGILFEIRLQNLFAASEVIGAELRGGAT
jgi:hypothetical protein